MARIAQTRPKTAVDNVAARLQAQPPLIQKIRTKLDQGARNNVDQSNVFKFAENVPLEVVFIISLDPGPYNRRLLVLDPFQIITTDCFDVRLLRLVFFLEAIKAEGFVLNAAADYLCQLVQLFAVGWRIGLAGALPVFSASK